jgi:hypothetical protein
MTALLLWIVRFFILYWIAKMAYVVVRRTLGGAQKSHGGQARQTRRFNTEGKKVADGNFREL